MKANLINILREVTRTSIQKDVSNDIVSSNQYSLTPEIISEKEKAVHTGSYGNFKGM